MSGELHDEAKAEVVEAAAYLESQRPGYGDRFLAAFESARQFVINHPRSGRPETSDVRAWPVQGFSYSIVYTLDEDEVFIVAVRHHRRLPGYWRSRLL
ncbi:MAG TPA: type II toxin-antitoxin system RelE/ParE family toxin [Thermoanaerobaculia bacterium]|jgi:plasmid stabilization system protein ParE|nr:type II toxin-antitoxin system RelE/ParE family toxin [Thermoanaerobaculia bacterium]